MEMINILQKFIRAERTGNWELHLQALFEMLPFLAASGHNNYTKSLWIYLQQMSSLKDDCPVVYDHFQKGFHVVRRSERFWGGLSTDLIIEQVLMRSMKTSGGLTRGRGMNENQRLTWVMAMPSCAEFNRTMQKLSGVYYNSGEQNKDISKARQDRDWKDIRTVLFCLRDRNPFCSEAGGLRNISTGVHAHVSANPHKARDVGQLILNKMLNESVGEFHFKKKDQVLTLDHKTSIRIDNEVIQIDPLLLFQRLTLVARTTHTLENVFKYELCSYPPALFESPLLLLQAQKPVLADFIWSLLDTNNPNTPSSNVQYVLVGVHYFRGFHGLKV